MLERILAVTLCVAGLGLAAPARGAPGDLDPSFGVDAVNGPGPFGPGMVVTDDHQLADYARGLVLESDGKIVYALGGPFGIRRRLPDGSFDGTFGDRGQYGITGIADLAIAADGNVIMTGYGVDAQEDYRYRGFVGRVNPDGLPTPSGRAPDRRSTLDRQFNRIAVADDGRLIAAGAYIRVVQPHRFAANRSLADLSADDGFGRGGRGSTTRPTLSTLYGATAVLPLTGGRVMLVGSAFPPGAPDFDIVLVRYAADGHLDRAFGTRGVVTSNLGDHEQAFDAALDGSGRIVVAGSTGLYPAHPRFLVVRYLPDGTLDPGFNGSGAAIPDFGDEDAEAYAVAIQADGKIVVAGEAHDTLALVRYLPDGTLDSTFGTAGLVVTPLPAGNTAESRALVIQLDGKLVVGGLACRQPPPASQPSCFYPVLARYLAD